MKKIPFLLISISTFLLISCDSKNNALKFDTSYFKGDWVYRSMLNIPDEKVPFSRVDSTMSLECSCTSDMVESCKCSSENKDGCKCTTTSKESCKCAVSLSKDCKCTSDIEFATAVMKFDKVEDDSIFGILDIGQYGKLNLRGKISSNDVNINIELQGDGIKGTSTDGWQYNYKGFVVAKWENAVNQLEACVGSVIRSKDHGSAKAGKTASFYMVKK
jgi:hypothetical protein